jgi:hypothetical protein
MAGNMAWDQSLVTVEATGVAGIFEYAVLSSPDATALTNWLIARGYRLDASAGQSLARYAREGWHFLAMRVRPELLGSTQGVLAPHPISYQYRSGRLVFPLEISRHSADDRNEIVLYVLASQRFTCTNWPAAALGEDLKLDSTVDTADKYRRLFETATARLSGRLFVVEYAGETNRFFPKPGAVDPAVVGDLRGWWITRLRAVVRPGEMDRDVELAPAAESKPVRPRSWYDGEASAGEAALPLALVGMVFGGRSLVRRRWWGRIAGGVLIAAACVGLAAM